MHSGKWKLFKDLQAITTTVNTSGTGYASATLGSSCKQSHK